MTLHNMYCIQLPKLRLNVPKCSAPCRDPLSILKLNFRHINLTHHQSPTHGQHRLKRMNKKSQIQPQTQIKKKTDLHNSYSLLTCVLKLKLNGCVNAMNGSVSDFLSLRRPADTLYGSGLLVGGRGRGRGGGGLLCLWHY